MKTEENKKNKKQKLTEEERDELKAEGELPSKPTRKGEDKQLFWFVAIIVLVFSAFLIPYFYMQNSKTFEYSHIDWAIEDYEYLRIYHGRFPSISDKNMIFNTFLRNDPRKNDVEVVGDFIKFKYGGIISLSPDANSCRGDLSRVMVDLGSFLSEGVGVGPITPALTNESIALSSGMKYATCESVTDRTVIQIELGDSKVVQNEENPFCYTIYAKDCQDILAVEKFIVHTVDSFGTLRDEALENSRKEQ
jgi:hypothetical protein